MQESARSPWKPLLPPPLPPPLQPQAPARSCAEPQRGATAPSRGVWQPRAPSLTLFLFFLSFSSLVPGAHRGAGFTARQAPPGLPAPCPRHLRSVGLTCRSGFFCGTWLFASLRRALWAAPTSLALICIADLHYMRQESDCLKISACLSFEEREVCSGRARLRGWAVWVSSGHGGIAPACGQAAGWA